MTIASIPQLPTMNIPMVTKGQNGSYTMTQYWHNFHTQLTQYLQTNLNQEGYQLPLLNSMTINQLTQAKNIGRIVFNTDTNQVFVGVTP